MENQVCGFLQKCWDHHRRPCLRPKGHMDDGNPNCHNPFSDSVSPKMEVITMRKPLQTFREKERELVSA